MTRRRLFLAATWTLLACHPTPSQPDLGHVGDPAPPKAPVLATLTEVGVLQGDARAGADVEPQGSVLGVSPEGFASTRQPIFLTFSTPMDASASRVAFDLEPSVGGTTTWTSPTRVAFQPEHSLAGANLYSVHASGEAKTRGGQSLEVEERWSFETPRPTAEIRADWSSYDDEERDRASWKSGFTIELSHDASERSIRDALRVGRVQGTRLRPQPFRLQRQYKEPGKTVARHWRVLPKVHWPADATIRVTLDDTLKTAHGTLSTGKEVFATLQTRAGFKVEVDCDDSATDGCVIGEFGLNFDAPIPKSALRKIRVSPKPKGFDPHPYIYGDEKTFSTVMFYGEYEAGRTYTVRLGKGIRDETGQALAGTSSRSITFVAPPPVLELEGMGTQLTGRKGTFGVESRSVEDAQLSISTLSNTALAELAYAQEDVRQRPKHGTETHQLELDLTPGGTWGWDAREFSLAKELGAPKGAAFVELDPGTVRADQEHRAPVGRTSGLVQFTNLGLLVGDSPAGGFVRVLTLDSATPVAGATAQLYTPSSPPKLLETFGPSDADGFIRIPSRIRLAKHSLVVETDDDRVALGLGGSGRGHWRSYGPPETGEEFDIGVVMTDRGLYQPGERMRVMGWVSRSSTAHAAGIEGSGARPVTVKLTGSGGEALAEAKVRTKTYGKFWATLEIPSTAKLGYARVTADVEGDGGGSFSRSVSLREFVAPAYDVSLSIKDPDLQHGQGTHVSAMARYLHGMPLPVAEASLRTQCYAQHYRPVDAAGFTVATPVTTAASSRSGWSPLQETEGHRKGRLDSDVKFRGLSKGHPYSCSITLLTMDAARQQLSTTTSAWVHPSRYLVVRHSSNKTRVGEPWTSEVRAVLPSGSPTTAKPAKLVFTREGQGEDEVIKPVHTCELQFDDLGVDNCSWTPRKRGRYRVTFIGGVDGVKVSQSARVFVAGRPDTASKEVRFAVSVPAHSAVGEGIDIDVQTRLPNATGVLVEVHAGIRATHAFTTQDHAAQLHLRTADTWVPTGYIDAFLAHPDGKDLPYVEHAFHQVELGYKSRELTVAVDNPAVASIGSTLPIDVAVTDPKGRPVGDAHVSVWAVDEGILMLRDWNFPEFTKSLAVDRGNEARYFDGYGDLRGPYTLREDPFEYDGAGGLGLSGRGSGYGAGSGRAGGRTAGPSPTTRRNFDPAPIFIGDIKTGPDGTARVHGLLPDNLTTFRIAAVATAEVAGTGAFARAGRSESKVRVTQDLSVRPVLPRVLRPGDQAQLGVLVDNLTDTPGVLEVKVELKDAAGLARITSEPTITRRLDGSQTRIPVSVEAQSPGEMLVWVSATLTTDDGRVLQDASELPLEIRVERTLERHAATYGSMSEVENGAIALDVPSPHIPDSAAASVDVSASMLGGYKGAAHNLVAYPYGCVEQTSSRLVPLAALHGLKDFDLGVSNVNEFVQVGLKRLESMQTREGGFGYWPGASHAHVYGTAYAAWVLTELKRAGIQVDDELLRQAIAFLNAELVRLRSYATPTAHDDARATMALLATASSGPPNELLDALVSRVDSLPTFSRALLAMAVHTNDANDPRLPVLLESLRDRVEVRGSTARSKAASRRFTALFDSPIRTDAMILLALVRAAPDDALIEPLARGLTEGRNRGELRNTQENAFALLAMSGYAELRESVEPDMDVRAWVGSDMLVDTEFEGRDLSLVHETAPIKGENPLVTLERLGRGRLYYRVGMTWAPKPGSIEPQAQGIAIERTIHDARGPLGRRSLVAGEAGTLEVVLTADARQRYVAIEVPLPAGVEAVDRSLGRGGASKTVGTSSGGHALPYSHHELRGDRVLVFVDSLPAGTYRYRVPVRATHEGRYSMPPATVHAMYSPEVSGNSGARQVRVVSP